MGAIFSAPVQTGRGAPPSLVYNGYRIFPGDKAAEAWRWPPTPSIAEVEERVQVYPCSPPGFSWPVLGRTLHLPLPLQLGNQKNKDSHVEKIWGVMCPTPTPTLRLCPVTVMSVQCVFCKVGSGFVQQCVNLLKPSCYVMHQQF